MRLKAVLASWMRSGWRGGLKLAGVIAAAGIATVVGLVVTGIWEDLGSDDDVAIQVEDRSPFALSEGSIVPLPRARLPPPPEIRGVTGESGRCATRGWVRSLGGAETETVFTVYAEGRAQRTVILDRVDVQVLRRRPPMRGSSILSCVPPARRAPVRELRVDLDSTPARVRYSAPDKVTAGSTRLFGRSRSRKFLFTLRRGEVEAFLVYALGGKCWCSWQLRFGYTVAGERRTVTIDDLGQPFETSGSSRAAGAGYKAGWRKLAPPPELPRDAQ